MTGTQRHLVIENLGGHATHVGQELISILWVSMNAVSVPQVASKAATALLEALVPPGARLGVIQVRVQRRVVSVKQEKQAGVEPDSARRAVLVRKLTRIPRQQDVTNVRLGVIQVRVQRRVVPVKQEV